MQSKIDNQVQFGQTLNPLKYVAKVSSIDNTSDLQDVFTKIDKLQKLWDDDSMDYCLSDTFQVWQKYQGRGKSITWIHKEYMSLLTCRI